MQPVRFDTSASEFTTTLYKRVNGYFAENHFGRKGNWQTWLKIVAMMTLYVGPFVILVTVPVSGIVAFGLCVVMGVGMAGVGMSVMHDAAHGAVSSKPWINHMVSRSIYLLGSNRLNWNVQHNHFHHVFTNVIGLDEDIGGRSVLRFSPHLPYKGIHRFQHAYAFPLYALLTISKLTKDFSQLVGYSKSPWELLNLCVTKAAYVTVAVGLPLLVTDYTWWQVLLGFTVMHLVGGFIMALVFQLAHVVEEVEQPRPNEAGMIQSEWAAHQLRTTANFAPKNRLLSWYVGGLNFQIEHHLLPAVSHIHYPALSAVVQNTAREFGLPYHSFPSLSAAVSSHHRMLRKLGAE